MKLRNVQAFLINPITLLAVFFYRMHCFVQKKEQQLSAVVPKSVINI